MNCPSCGTLLGPADRFCPTCGAPVNAQAGAPAQPANHSPVYKQTAYNQPDAQYQAPAQAPQSDPAKAHFPLPDPTFSIDRQNVPKSLYFSNLASDKVRKRIKFSAAACYVCAAITGLAALVLPDSYLMLIDSIVLIVLGVLIRVKQSRAAAVILLAYSLINSVFTFVETGTFGGWFVLAAGVLGVWATFALDKEYKQYRGQ